MADTEDAQALLNAAKCNFCVIPPGLAWYAVLSSLITVGNGGTVSTDPQVIISESKCLACVIPAGFLPYAILAAVSDISTGGGGGGSGTGQSGIVGSGSPEGGVTAEPGTIYWDSAGQSLWIKNSGSGNVGWTQLIS